MGKDAASISRSNQTVTVTVPREVAYDLRKIQKIQEDLLGRLGHPGCYSGWDILFRTEIDYSVNAKTLELQGVASRIG